MNDSFTLRVRAAAIAGWWTVLIAIGFLILILLGYEWLICSRPAWVLRLWGPDITWVDAQHIGLWVIIAFRFTVWLILLATIWLTLWSRRLRKTAG